ncbi:PEP-CTERM sorting domain-containing protein [Nitrosovibrio sp. Nv17]|jgi:hypothetical protein|uniref:PEP-CTERM sorting domain-containing protein n=1 Tax=Nitrosovibrio sp. Nv17 TaxID=1855339 RepID=UPI0009085325|nr:PEP-CTERM sorting domain-containing protein [Nitrosovibrio sp. Nv17]SFW15521.1 PEP-CTERM protein-sorting domain-containing protein [Nitrosovibrio sp. Nv17]
MKLKAIAVAAGLVLAGPALADYGNGPDPYAPGYGFDTPTEASWGGWTRGDAGTVYAEWDSFTGGSAGTGSREADYGFLGANTATLSWNNAFVAGSGNLYAFSGTVQSYTINVTPTTAFSGPVTVALQFETWGTPIDYNSVKLNGLAPSNVGTGPTPPPPGEGFPSNPVWIDIPGDVTYFGPTSSSIGAVDLSQYLAVWTLDSAPASFDFAFNSTYVHQSFAQVAVDIAAAPIPEPGEWAMLLAGLGLMGAIVRRRNTGGKA